MSIDEMTEEMNKMVKDMSDKLDQQIESLQQILTIIEQGKRD